MVFIYHKPTSFKSSVFSGVFCRFHCTRLQAGTHRYRPAPYLEIKTRKGAPAHACTHKYRHAHRFYLYLQLPCLSFFFIPCATDVIQHNTRPSQEALCVLSHALPNALCWVANTGLTRVYSMQPNDFIFPKRKKKQGHFIIGFKNTKNNHSINNFFDNQKLTKFFLSVF